MSEDIDVGELIVKHDLKDFVAWAMITMMTSVHQDIREFGPIGKYQVDLKINGIDVPITTLFKELESQFDSMVLVKANELLQDKLYDMMNLLSRMQDSTKALVREAGDKLGYKLTYGYGDDD